MHTRRMTAAEFRRSAFIGKPPALSTIRRMVQRRELPGEIRGSACWIFVDERGQPADAVLTTAAQAAAAQLIQQWQNGESG